jgi:hypothetical protein
MQPSQADVQSNTAPLLLLQLDWANSAATKEARLQPSEAPPRSLGHSLLSRRLGVPRVADVKGLALGQGDDHAGELCT